MQKFRAASPGNTPARAFAHEPGLKYGLMILEISGDCALTLGEYHVAPPKKTGARGRPFWEFTSIDYGKGFRRASAQSYYEANGAIIIPCNKEAMENVRSFLDLQVIEHHYDSLAAEYLYRSDRGYTGPYYFSQTMVFDAEFETAKENRAFFGHEYTAYSAYLDEQDEERWEKFELARKAVNSPNLRKRFFKKHADDYVIKKMFNELENQKILKPVHSQTPFARFNCWTGAQGIIQYIAGIDLARIHNDLPYFYRASHAMNWHSLFNDYLRDAGKNKKYEILSNTNDGILAKHGNAPPFFVMPCQAYTHGKYSEVPAILKRRTNTGMSIHKYLMQLAEQDGLFKPTDLEKHRHMRVKRKPNLINDL